MNKNNNDSSEHHHEQQQQQQQVDDDNNEEEEPWIEAQGGLYPSTLSVRGKLSRISNGGNHDEEVKEDDDEEEEDDWEMNQLFADPDPIQEFELEWQLLPLPSSSSSSSLLRKPFSSDKDDDNENGNNNNNNNEANCNEDNLRTISIQLRGHKPENGQTLSSTGLTLWKGSELLCNYLVQQYSSPSSSSSSSLFSGCWSTNRCHYPHRHPHHHRDHPYKVLELGAGLGVCGILAYRLLSSHHHQHATVVLTDGDSETLQWLRANVQRNMISSSSTTTTSSSSSTMDADSTIMTHSTTTITCAQLQWGIHLERFQQRHGSNFDLILASDIIYVEEILHPLWQTVHALLLLMSSSSSSSSSSSNSSSCNDNNKNKNNKHKNKNNNNDNDEDNNSGGDDDDDDSNDNHTNNEAADGGRFCLSFVRRNVSWDLVLAVAQEYDMELLQAIPQTALESSSSSSTPAPTITTATAAAAAATFVGDGVFVFGKRKPKQQKQQKQQR